MTIYWITLGVIAGVLLFAKMAWALLLSMFPEQLHTSEIHTIVTPDLWKLRLCRYRRGRTGGDPVLLVHGLNANQHNFTIPADASLVDNLVTKGYDCWTIDLRGSRSSVPPFEHERTDVRLDDYLTQDLTTAVRYIKDATRYEKIHWIGHSLGGMLLYAYVQKYGDDDFASGTTLGSPVGFKGVDMQWLEDAVFFVSRMPRFFGALMRAYIPLRGKIRINIPLFPTNMRNIAPGLTGGEVFNLIDDPLPHVLRTMAGWAAKEEWTMLDGELRPAEHLDKVQLPLLTFFGPEDPFVPLDHAQSFFENLPNPDKKLIILSKENGCAKDYSHCEQIFGKNSRREVFEPIARWLEVHPINAPARDFDGNESEELAPLKPLDKSARDNILSGSSFSHLAPNGSEETPKRKILPRKRPAGKVKRSPKNLPDKSEG